MDFGIPQRRKGFCVTEICPFCDTRLVITDQRIILNNEEITCLICKNTYRLDVNSTKDKPTKEG
ncbi:hypothetical protein LCGC14_0305860 [marine sediment metagenome]|uniref:Uncharacterized protein n=1 Tax=marine sediment metagenome TaxID=412755 RepID=A0A0F9U662_9ZZZZ